jgi:hypothetical protein
MIACRLRLDDRGDAGRVQPRQQDRRLHLGRSHRQFVGNGHGLGGSDHGERRTAAGARNDARPHARERLRYARHRARTQAGVAREEGDEIVRRNQAHEQPRAGAGIAEIQHLRRFAQATDAATPRMPHAVDAALRLAAEEAHGGGGAQHIFPFQQAVDLGLAHRQRAQHQRAVRDRFVARHARGALEGRCGARGKRLRGNGSGHGGWTFEQDRGWL